MNNFLQEIKEKLNIDLLGVCKAEDLEFRRKLLDDRNQQEISTSFEHEDTSSRIDPRKKLESAKSIIVIGKSYAWDYEKSGDFKNSIHSSARDYHKVLGELLDNLIEELSVKYEFSYYKQVDSGPLLEKEYARLANLGMIGKNTLLINKDYGSFIFLGLLLTDIEFEEYSQAYTKDCGSCRICVDACPTGALQGDYTIDSSKCLSYLSQWKGINEYSKNMIYAYGCDICQNVCPKNINIKKNIDSVFKPSLSNFDNEDLDHISNNEFRRRYGEYSFSWVGRKTLLRNIEMIKGNKNVCRNIRNRD